MYVADQDQHLIRRISRGGAVTTLFGRTDMVSGAGRARRHRSLRPRPGAAGDAARGDRPGRRRRGVRPDIYVPMTVRVDSRGPADHARPRRRADPPHRSRDRRDRRSSATSTRSSRSSRSAGPGSTSIAGATPARRTASTGASRSARTSTASRPRASTSSTRGCRPTAACRASSSATTGSRTRTGGASARRSGLEHYAWLVAVDPRGALLVAGMGEHGISRLRAERSSDRAPDELYPRLLRGADAVVARLARRHAPSFALKFGWDGHNYLGLPRRLGPGRHRDRSAAVRLLLGARRACARTPARPTSGSTRCGRTAARRRGRPRLRHRPARRADATSPKDRRARSSTRGSRSSTPTRRRPMPSCAFSATMARW